MTSSDNDSFCPSHSESLSLEDKNLFQNSEMYACENSECTDGGDGARSSFPVFETLTLDDVYRDLYRISADVGTVVNVPPEDLIGMLAVYKWDVERFQDEWFSDLGSVQKGLGVREQVDCSSDPTYVCNVCFDTFESSTTDILHCGCGHGLCRECWGHYVHARMELGSVMALNIKCPIVSCGRRANNDLLLKVMSDDDIRMIKKYAMDSYVENARNIVWCPGLDCARAVKRQSTHGKPARDVFCSWCKTEFCFDCQKEAHRPVDCDLVKIWLVTNDKESKNLTWILANTKGCPKCTRPIEKDRGCMHMTCSQCRHEFCWLCLGDWRKHGQRTGGFYNCSIYNASSKGSQDKSAESRSRERRLYFWERWAEHDKALNFIKTSIDRWDASEIGELSAALQIPASQLKFVSDAWKEVERCRRTLKWIYVAAYFTFNGSGDDPTVQNLLNVGMDSKYKSQLQEFFEFTQNDAESALERLSHRVETDLQSFIPSKRKEDGTSTDAGPSSTDVTSAWESFRKDLIRLTDVTGNQFAKLLKFLEHGLDKSIQEIRDQAHTQQNHGGSGYRGSLMSLKTARNINSTPPMPPPNWRCKRCGLTNSPERSTCELCELHRQ